MNDAAFRTLLARFGRTATQAALRDTLAALRATKSSAEIDALALRCAEQLERLTAPSLRPVYNLTGTVLHTNLGRAVLPQAACAAVSAAMARPSNLEFALDRGERGDRDDHIERLICRLTGAEAATIVNNNAAAVLLVLNTFAQGREAIVSRGELIEIGGSFRMPEIMARAGAIVREIGTTNRTHLADYDRGIGEATGLVLKVHTSNYAIQGFAASVGERQLGALCRSKNVPFAVDLGSGALVDLAAWGLPREPVVGAVTPHADIVTFSGDKLLGGVQCGFVVGRRDSIAEIKRNPLKRALRVGKMTIAAMEAVLRLYLYPEHLAENLPVLRQLTRSPAEIRAAAERLLPPVAASFGRFALVRIAACESQIGSGALPLETLPSFGLAIAPARGKGGSGRWLHRLSSALRALPVPVIGRIEANALLLDLRTLDDEAGFLDQIAHVALSENYI